MKLSRKTNNRITGILAAIAILCLMNNADPTGNRQLSIADFLPNILGLVLFSIVAVRCHFDYQKHENNER